jgi:peptidoglycan hydrolase CwlO-like protein
MKISTFLLNRISVKLFLGCLVFSIFSIGCESSDSEKENKLSALQTEVLYLKNRVAMLEGQIGALNNSINTIRTQLIWK